MNNIKRFTVCMIMILVASIGMAQEVISHVVERGETLESIAQKYGITTSQLREANPDINDFFYVGMKLSIPQLTKTELQKKSQNNISDSEESVLEERIPIQVDSQNNIGNTFQQSVLDSKANSWHFFFRLGPSIFRTEKSGSLSRNDSKSYSTSVGFEITLGVHYYFTDQFYLSGGLGYYSASSSTSLSSIGDSFRSETTSHNIILPIEVGVVFPISSKFGIVLQVGPSLLYTVGGKMKIGNEEMSFSEWENNTNQSIDKFSAFARVGGGIKWEGFTLMGYYGIPLTKTFGGGDKKNFWGITIGHEF